MLASQPWMIWCRHGLDTDPATRPGPQHRRALIALPGLKPGETLRPGVDMEREAHCRPRLMGAAVVISVASHTHTHTHTCPAIHPKSVLCDWLGGPVRVGVPKFPYAMSTNGSQVYKETVDAHEVDSHGDAGIFFLET